jgi:D-arabinan exo alpha-(1,3)/(1,5)-arabinofuranosidase (non-reducing end)
MRAAAIALVLSACGSPAPAAIDGIPIIPIGYDAYRHLDELPTLHLLDRAYMRSTYDRAGGNEGADASHFIREETDGTFTTLDMAGPGMLVFTRANHWHGSPWHEVVDGTDHVVTESSTATPNAPVNGSVFLPAAALPPPLAITWSQTQGADLDWVPVPFTQSLRLSDERTHYGTGYYIVHSYPVGAEHLSAPLAAWREEAPPDDVLQLFARAGRDIAPAGVEHEATVDVGANATASLPALAGALVIRRIAIDAPAAEATALANVHLRITWDGRASASVDAPLGLLFAGGSLYDRDARPVLVGGLLANVTYDADRVHLAIYFPMPFSQSADLALVGGDMAVSDVHVAIRTLANTARAGTQGYFHATFVDHGTPVPGQDLVLLDTTMTEGGGDWCGTFAGTSFTFSDAAVLSTLEGDPRFFFDDARSPQAYGTGTEEWAGGGDYWGGIDVTLPLAGHPTGAPSAAAAHNATDQIESAYRFLIADAMPFGKNARIQLEHGAGDDSTEHYRTVTYWYGAPSACLVQTDTLQVGDVQDETAHAYTSPTASDPQSITSRWDGLGVDAGDPVDTLLGRSTTATTTFTAAIDPHNEGVLLRRTLDYALADQRAAVFVADDDGALHPAGTWYLAGSTTVLYSNPPGELDAAAPVMETVDRRFRDDEFLLPRALTEGRSRITIQLRALTAWSELRYAVYSYVLPTP